jgi:peroxiredoxin
LEKVSQVNSMRIGVFGLVCAVAAVPLVAGASGVGDAPTVKVGDPAPTFRLPTYNPEEAKVAFVALDTLVGPESTDAATRAVLVSFFATWCGPCKKEMPYLQTLFTEMQPKGLKVLMISIDKEEKAVEEVKALVKKNGVTFPVLKDRFNLLARRYLGDKTPLPSVFIIKKDGSITMVNQGYNKDASEFLRAEVEKALAN